MTTEACCDGMPPAPPPTPEQVADWVRAGHITEAQGRALAAGAAPPRQPPAAARSERASLLGPRPSLRGTGPPALGLLVALAASVLAVLVDTLVAKRTRSEPGDVLDWLPTALGALLLLAALAATGRARPTLLAAAAGLTCLLTALHPDPRPWMYAVPAVVAVAVLAVRLDPATRIVATLPGLLGLVLVTMALLEDWDAQSILTVAVAGTYLFAVWFLLPYESGWRRLPFLAHAVLSGLIVLAVLTVVLLSIVQNGIRTPDSLLDSDSRGDGTLSTLGLLLLLMAYPAATWLAWLAPRARAFLLPSLPLPRIAVRSVEAGAP